MVSRIVRWHHHMVTRIEVRNYHKERHIGRDERDSQLLLSQSQRLQEPQQQQVLRHGSFENPPIRFVDEAACTN